MSIKTEAPTIRVRTKGPEREVRSLYIADRSKVLLDFLRKESGSSQDEVLFDALNLYKYELEKVKNTKYDLEEILQ